jgi:hypothetical protein
MSQWLWYLFDELPNALSLQQKASIPKDYACCFQKQLIKHASENKTEARKIGNEWILLDGEALRRCAQL